jgi:hypothetical protein
VAVGCSFISRIQSYPTVLPRPSLEDSSTCTTHHRGQAGSRTEATGGQDPSFDSYLISWIPPCFVDSVTAGISVNPEQCIQWLEDADVMLARSFAGSSGEPGRQ